MLLREFFSKPVVDKKDEDLSEELMKEVMGFILDHDDLHKKHFLPMAWNLHKHMKEETYDHKKAHHDYMDMVNEGCIEYFEENEMTGDPNKHFPYKMRAEMARQLADLHEESIKAGDFEGRDE
jgi:hypothetical protein